MGRGYLRLNLLSGWVLPCLLPLLGCFVPSLAKADPLPNLSFEKDIRPTLEAHCFKCHSAEKPKGGINLEIFKDEKSIAKQRKLWRNVARQIEALEMPPAGEKAIPAGLRTAVVPWIKNRAEVVDCANPNEQNPGRSVIRRLNRAEYNRTIRDLLDIEFDAGAEVGLPEEPVGHGYTNQATALNLPPTLMDKYFAAADRLLEKLFPKEEPKIDPKNKIKVAEAQRFQAARANLLSVVPSKLLTESQTCRKMLEAFLPKAFRRSVNANEIQRYQQLFEISFEKTKNFDASVRLTLKAVLVSPNFLFRIEQESPKAESKGYLVSDTELAVRLSYFLWSSMPDAELRKVAQEKRLSQPAELQKQVTRMLADPKAKALTDEFAVQWLQLRKLADARPSTEFFPTFTPKLRQSLMEETTLFFDSLRTENRSILELLDADYGYLNEDLAKHYNIKGVTGPEMRRVSFQPNDHRGGLLTMGSMLALTSHTSRTSPTLRGKWVLETIFGTPPAPPPAEVGNLDDVRDKGKVPKTFREKMALHAKQAHCAACHAKIDPLGFGLENYDAVGRWRDSSVDLPLDTRGQLPTGERFDGPQELKQIIKNRQKEFLRNFNEQMLSYALGRELQYYDDCTVQEMLNALEKNGYRFSAVIQSIVQSYPFRHRRNSDSVDE